MLPYLETLDRADSGEPITEKDWDFDKILLPTRRLVKDYHLEWDRAEIIPTDASVVDSIFRAGYELAVETGVYCRSTGRIIAFSQDEIEAALGSMPQALTMGEGDEACSLYARLLGDERPPLSFGGSPGTPIPENCFLENVISYAQEPLIDLLTCGSLTEVDNRPVRAGHPLEIVAARRELAYLHTALEKAGRPGMGMLAAQSSVTELGDLALAQRRYLRPCDAHLVPLLNELKLDFRNAARVVNSLEYGMINASLPCVIVGGLGGGPPGAAVVNVASFLLANLVCYAGYHILHPIHLRHVATSTREVLWVTSAVGQAFARNAPAIIVADVYPKSGAGTKELLYETAANAIVNAASACHLEGCGSADGLLPNCSGLEARFMVEAALAAHRMKLTPADANRWALRLLPRYEHIFSQDGGNPGLPFDQVYDLHSVQPTPAWVETYQQVKEDLKAEGLELI